MLSAEFIIKSMPLICCEELTKNATVSATSVVVRIFFSGWLSIICSKILSSISEVSFVCISDGETVWTYLSEDNECYIDLLDDLENSINPNEIFSIWKEGFKFEYVKENIIANESIHEIKMFPENPSKSKYHTLLMEINENQSTIQQAIIKSKDGVTIKFKIIELIANPILAENTFIWDKNNHPNVDEIDNR